MNQTLTETLTQDSTEIFGYTLPLLGDPVYDLLIITLVASLFITLVNKKFSDQVRLKALRAEMKKLQKEMRSVMTKDPQAAQKIQQKIMRKNMENMKEVFNLKVLAITAIPLMVVFLFVSHHYGHFGDFFNFLWIFQFGWLGTYIVFSLIWSILLKKVLDVA